MIEIKQFGKDISFADVLKIKSMTGVCEKHGETEFFSIFGRKPCCSKCNDEQDLEEKRKIEEARRRKFISLCHIPVELEGCTFDNYKASTHGQQELLAQVQSIADDFAGRIVVFLGSYGLGKSHLAVACLKKVGGLYLKASEMTRGYNALYPSDKEKVFNEWCAKRLLVIDEIGTGSVKDELPLLQDVIATRYDKHSPMILISNMNLNVFLDYVGGLIKSRLASLRGEYILFEGQDYRQLVS